MTSVGWVRKKGVVSDLGVVGTSVVSLSTSNITLDHDALIANVNCPSPKALFPKMINITGRSYGGRLHRRYIIKVKCQLVVSDTSNFHFDTIPSFGISIDGIQYT